MMKNLKNLGIQFNLMTMGKNEQKKLNNAF